LNEITYQDGMKLWLYVWDSGNPEGFAVYINDNLLTESNAILKKYDIEPLGPGESWGILVRFAGQDGGATKVVDEGSSPHQVEGHQDDGVVHGYLIKRP
jgi:hypothetical protein